MNNLHKNTKILLMLLLIIPFVGFSQSKDKQATEILQKVTAKTKAYSSIKLEFSYQMENPGANINQLTEGKALISGEKYHLDIAGETVISDGKTIWTVIADAEEVQVNDVQQGDDGFSLTSMLTTYNDDYKSKLLPNITTMDGKNVYALALTPNEKKTFDKVQLFVDKDKMYVYSIALYDQNGSVYTYKITSFIPNAPDNAKYFTFDEADFPNFDVIDMR